MWADDLAPDGAMPSGVTMHTYTHHSVDEMSAVSNYFCWPDGVIQNDPQDLSKSRDTSIINTTLGIYSGKMYSTFVIRLYGRHFLRNWCLYSTSVKGFRR